MRTARNIYAMRNKNAAAAVFMDMPTRMQNTAEGNGPASTTLMLLEPDVIARMTIAEYLRDCGYRVIEGDRAEDAFAVLAEGIVINIILSEVRLAGAADGFELARTVREKYPDIDIILTAGVANTANKVGKLCDDGPLTQPYHPQELLRRIRIVQQRRAATGT